MLKQNDPKYQRAYEQFYKGLEKYVPEQSLPTIAHWLAKYQVALKITGHRTSKRGDYRSPRRGKGHQISINASLNPYAFLTTLTHEIAHLTTFEKYGHIVKPHGSEWKRDFQKLMLFFLGKTIFPKEIEQAIYGYLKNPAASSCTSPELIRAFKKYDKTPLLPDGFQMVFVEAVPMGVRFMLEDGRVFVKGKKLRKRYECMELSTQRLYVFSPISEVVIKKGN